MRVLITGANGFIGRNLRQHLAERADLEVLSVTRDSSGEDLAKFVSMADFVFHLAGVNRPKDPAEFQEGNAGFTEQLCGLLAQKSRDERVRVPVVFSSARASGMQRRPYSHWEPTALCPFMFFGYPMSSANGPARTTTPLWQPFVTTSPRGFPFR